MPDTSNAISIKSLTYDYGSGPIILDVPLFEVPSGARLFLRGPSGSGKSTLLGLIAGVLENKDGTINILGHDMSAISASDRDRLRAERMGVIFQMFNLLPYLSVGENVLLSCRFSAVRAERATANGGTLEEEARRILTSLGLSPETYWNAHASDLSVGQQQRVAAARALIGAPELILADEPTSALDTDNREAFIDLLLEETQKSGASLLFVSHDASLATRFDGVLDLSQINQVRGLVQ